MTGPTIATARLRLVPHAPSDLDEMAAVLGDPAVMGPIGVAPATREECWHRLLRYLGHWATVGYGHWTARDASTGTYLGEVGLMDSRRDTDPGFEGTPEVAWAFAPHAQGQGLAAEACAAMLRWADNRGVARTVAMIAPTNTPSIRLAGRLGYGPAGEVAYRDRPALLFARDRP